MQPMPGRKSPPVPASCRPIPASSMKDRASRRALSRGCGNNSRPLGSARSARPSVSRTERFWQNHGRVGGRLLRPPSSRPSFGGELAETMLRVSLPGTGRCLRFRASVVECGGPPPLFPGTAPLGQDPRTWPAGILCPSGARTFLSAARTGRSRAAGAIEGERAEGGLLRAGKPACRAGPLAVQGFKARTFIWANSLPKGEGRGDGKARLRTVQADHDFINLLQAGRPSDH